MEDTNIAEPIVETQVRKMASIQKIVDIQPIEGADKIVCATVLGWKCVTQKSNNFKPGDLVIYFEIDSLIPNTPWSSFLFMDKNAQKTHHKLKTIRLRGQVSQGLILPLDSKEVSDALMEGKVEEYTEGYDVSGVLKIEKWEAHVPAQLQGICKSTFPSWIPKTDETRIQAWPWILQDLLKGRVLIGTEKLDGSSMTTYIRDGVFGVCSRNMDLLESEGNSFWVVARKLDIENKLRSLTQNIAIQGELIGPGVQKNKYKLTELTMRVFNAFDIDKRDHLEQDELEKLCLKLDLPLAPLMSMTEVDEVVNVDYLVKMVSGLKSKINPETPIEGIVFRTIPKVLHPKYGRVSFKVINPEFLLKYNE